MIDQSAKSLCWLANQFPVVEQPKDNADRISTCIHLYCTSGADTIDTLTDQLAALQAENGDLRAALSRMEAERDAAMAYVPHTCSTCKHKKNGVCGMGCEFARLTINYAERCNWEWRSAQGEG